MELCRLFQQSGGIEQDHQQARDHDHAHAELEEILPVPFALRLDMPGEFLQPDHRHHQDRREDRPDWHHHAVADEIQCIQYIEPFVFFDECQRMHVREDAVAEHRDRTDDRDLQQTVEQRRSPRQPHFLADRMDIGLQQGNGRSRRGEQDQDEEHRAEETSRRKTGEHLRHGHEDQPDARILRRFFSPESHHTPR